MAGDNTLIYLARHGQTALNESGRLRGLLDPPLDETGRRQAALLGEALGSRRLALVAASPLRRARQTAQPVADRAGLTVTEEHSLLDRDYGPWAGTREDAVIAEWGSVDAAPGVEPRSAIRTRALDGLTALSRRYPGAMLVAVSHDAVNREVLAALDSHLGDPDGIPQDNGCFNILRWADETITVLSINNVPGAQGGTMAEMPTVQTLDELTQLVGRHPGMFVRWSRGPAADVAGTSADDLTGEPLPGLSANPLAVEPWWGDRPLRLWIARRLFDYSHLKHEKGPGVRPWLLEGRELGRGPDNEPLVECDHPVAWIDDRVISEAVRIVEEQNAQWGPLHRFDPSHH